MKQLVWAFALLAAAVPGRADAMCGIPQWFGTADSSALPVKGSLYVHHEGMQFAENGVPMPRIAWTGASSTVAVAKISDVVYRIDYDAPQSFGAKMSTDDDYDSWRDIDVTFDPAWRAPATAPRVVQFWHHVYRWTCSSADTVKIQLDQPVAGVRVRWTFADETREFIEAPRADEATVLELGQINCGGTTIDPEELAAGGHLELIAIRPDRSEVRISGLPARFSTEDMPVDDSDRAMHVQPLVVAPQAIAEPKQPEDPPSNALGMIVLGLFGLGGLLALRFRVRAPDYLR